MSLTVKFDLKPLSPDDPEFEEIRAAVQEGLEQADRGELYPVATVFAEIRKQWFGGQRQSR